MHLKAHKQDQFCFEDKAGISAEKLNSLYACEGDIACRLLLCFKDPQMAEKISSYFVFTYLSKSWPSHTFSFKDIECLSRKLL